MARDVKTIDQLADEIAKSIQAYTDDVSEGITKVTKETANAICSEVKRISAGQGHENYATGFKINDRSTKNNSKYAVWNKKYYRLVHLLEKGHIIATGKNAGKRTTAYPHMGIAERKYTGVYVKRVKEIIRNGGG